MTDVVSIASWNADLTVHVPRPLRRGETVRASGFEIGPGGKGSNAAIAAARQGAAVALIARVGDDDFGRMGRAVWAAEGIDTRHVETAPGERSGVAQIQVFDDGDNSIAVFGGANAALGAAQAQAAAATLARCRVVMASCEVPLACTAEAFRLARAGGALTVLNPAPACPLPDALLALVDVLTPNEGELAALAGAAGAAGPAAAAAALQARGAAAVLVTLGAAGCRLHAGGAAPALVLAGHRMPVCDSVGAGDTFTGALAAALARGLALPQAARWANAAAALSVRRAGAIAGMPSQAEVAAFLGG